MCVSLSFFPFLRLGDADDDGDGDGDLRMTLSSAGPTSPSRRRRWVGSLRLSWKRASRRPLTISGVIVYWQKNYYCFLT